MGSRIAETERTAETNELTVSLLLQHDDSTHFASLCTTGNHVHQSGAWAGKMLSQWQRRSSRGFYSVLLSRILLAPTARMYLLGRNIRAVSPIDQAPKTKNHQRATALINVPQVSNYRVLLFNEVKVESISQLGVSRFQVLSLC
jgi:hypothetical protein